MTNPLFGITTQAAATAVAAAQASLDAAVMVWQAVSAILPAGTPPHPPPPPPTPVGTLLPLTRAGAHLQVGGVNVKLSGVNTYWLGLDDNIVKLGSLPNQPTITAAFDGMREMGVNLCRSTSLGTSMGTPLSFLTGYSGGVAQYNDANLLAADWAIYQAGLHGIYLMLPMVDNWNYYHGGLWWLVHQAFLQNPAGIIDVNSGYTGGAGKDDPNQRVFFAASPAGLRCQALYGDYVTHCLRHVNPFTKLAWKDDPAVAIIESGNEIYFSAQVGGNAWLQWFCALVKSVAPGKLTADGAAASGQAGSTMPGLTAPDCDIVGGHYYPQIPAGTWPPTTFGDPAAKFPAGTARQQLAADVAVAAANNRPFLVGEYPWTRADVSAFYADLATPGVAGDLAWSYIGGAEVHGSVFGSDDFPVHRPYLPGMEATYGPALASHISGITGIAKSNGA